MSNTVSSPAVTTAAADLAAPRKLSSTGGVFAALLRADLTTQWRNRRASVMVFLLPVIILFAWKPLIERIGGAGLLGNCITLGLNAIGLMGYTNSIARDRDKGIFQRLRVSPAPNWTIMVSRLTVQLVMIGGMTLVVFIVGYQYDHVSLSIGGYIASFLAALVCGSVYLALGQAIVGRITNPESVNATSRLIYIAFIMIGMFGELGMLGEVLNKVVIYSPYGTVESVVAAALAPATWNSHTSLALLLTLGYTGVFAYLGIKWFKWNSR
ncbi:MAG TPA: ABC transporter permease [Puia sp.]|jgi:ABC-2 type transport system permease protein|nr:ABC transporter permease [Puia sp.]